MTWEPCVPHWTLFKLIQPQNCSGALTELLWLRVPMFINRFSPGWGSQCLLLLCAADRQGFGECRCARASLKMGFKWSWTCSSRNLSQWEAPHPQGTLRCKLTGYLPLLHSTHSTSTGGLKAPSLQRISATKPLADCFSNSPLPITWRNFRLGPVKLLLIRSDGNRGKFCSRVHRKLIGWTYRHRDFVHETIIENIELRTKWSPELVSTA